MNKKRETVTLSRVIIEPLKLLSDENRLIVYDTLLSHFLDGTEVVYEKLPEVIQVTLASLLPQLRKVQSKFENGVVKKSNFNDTGSFCQFEASEFERNKADFEAGSSPNYNNINNYINNKNQSINQSSEPARERVARGVVSALAPIKNINPSAYQRAARLLNKVYTMKCNLNINGRATSPVQMLSNFLGTATQLQPNELAEALQKVFINIDSKKLSKVNDLEKYSIAALNNLATVVPKNMPGYTQQKASGEMLDTRNYSKTDFESLFDDLERIEI